MRARVEEMGGSVAVPEESAPPRPATEEPVVEPAVEAPVAEEPPAADEAAPAPGERSTDEEGARLAALDLALSGAPRDEAERYLAEHFDLADPVALLDDVYARVGR